MTNENIFLNFDKHLVAFIDVMGFKELLNGDPQILQSYYNHAYEFLEGKSNNYKQTNPDDDFKRLFVSDSIILSVRLTDNRANNLRIAATFFSSVALLQYVLAINACIWTRGAVSIGDLYIEEDRNLLVGKAFVQAYELENLADYPRVIVDPKILKFFDMNQADFIKKIDSFGHTAGLLGAGSTTRWGMNTFMNDAIQIDWFRHAFDRPTEKLDTFFEDLRQRQFSNQALFEKSNRLIEYLAESVAHFRSVHHIRMEQDFVRERVRMILSLLRPFIPGLEA